MSASSRRRVLDLREKAAQLEDGIARLACEMEEPVAEKPCDHSQHRSSSPGWQRCHTCGAVRYWLGTGWGAWGSPVAVPEKPSPMLRNVAERVLRLDLSNRSPWHEILSEFRLAQAEARAALAAPDPQPEGECGHELTSTLEVFGGSSFPRTEQCKLCGAQRQRRAFMEVEWGPWISAAEIARRTAKPQSETRRWPKTYEGYCSHPDTTLEINHPRNPVSERERCRVCGAVRERFSERPENGGWQPWFTWETVQPQPSPLALEVCRRLSVVGGTPGKWDDCKDELAELSRLGRRAVAEAEGRL